MGKEQLKHRTKEFAKDIVRLCRTLPNNREGRLIGDQLFRSGTSVASNYRAACRGRSRRDFIAKMGIVEEEADESLFWLEMLKEMTIVESQQVEALIQEGREILAMVVSSIRTARSRS